MSAATIPQDVTTITPEWVPELLAVGGAQNPFVTIPDAAPFVPWSAKKCYRMANAYMDRSAQERKRRRSQLVPVEFLYPKDGELTAQRDGRTVLLSKRYLVIKLLGYLPTSAEGQP